MIIKGRHKVSPLDVIWYTDFVSGKRQRDIAAENYVTAATVSHAISRINWIIKEGHPDDSRETKEKIIKCWEERICQENVQQE